MNLPSKQQLGLPLVWVSSSAVGAPPLERHFGRGNASRWTDVAWENFAADHAVHKMLLRTVDSSEHSNSAPLFYYRSDSSSYFDAPISNSATTSLNALFYAQIEEQLRSLRAADDEVTMEEGAIDTALIVLRELQKHDIIPPLVTAQGNDAVVMLWSIRNATYAITITDGELGYIVRQLKRQLKKQDSIKVDKFSLPALTSHAN